MLQTEVVTVKTRIFDKNDSLKNKEPVKEL